jgi:type IV/VI secretion system ImpK/VasF family protein
VREDIANLVYPVLGHGLRLKERLDGGEVPSIDVEQAALRTMLLTEADARRRPDFGGDVERPAQTVVADAATEGRAFLGVRYALACWLDELLILHSPWSAAWNERKLEATLYGTNDRAWKFWEQAELAAARPTPDALEGFFLCVVLGFRGELGLEPERFATWFRATQDRLARGPVQPWQAPPELDPPTYVPPLRARDRLHRLVLTGGLILLCLVPVAALLAVLQFGR